MVNSRYHHRKVIKSDVYRWRLSTSRPFIMRCANFSPNSVADTNTITAFLVSELYLCDLFNLRPLSLTHTLVSWPYLNFWRSVTGSHRSHYFTLSRNATRLRNVTLMLPVRNGSSIRKLLPGLKKFTEWLIILYSTTLIPFHGEPTRSTTQGLFAALITTSLPL